MVLLKVSYGKAYTKQNLEMGKKPMKCLKMPKSWDINLLLTNTWGSFSWDTTCL